MVGIVERLRQTRADMLGTPDEAHYWDCVEAADEIEKLRAALKPFADAAPHYCICNEHDDWFVDGEYITIGDLRAAAAALKETGDE